MFMVVSEQAMHYSTAACTKFGRGEPVITELRYPKKHCSHASFSDACGKRMSFSTLNAFNGAEKEMHASKEDARLRFMIWCRAGIRANFLSVYTDLFYEPQTLEKPLNSACTIPCVTNWALFWSFKIFNFCN